MEKWPIGVFASIDAGLGVKLEVARELGVPTIQLHAPHRATRTKVQFEAIMARLGVGRICAAAVSFMRFTFDRPCFLPVAFGGDSR